MSSKAKAKIDTEAKSEPTESELARWRELAYPPELQIDDDKSLPEETSLAEENTPEETEIEEVKGKPIKVSLLKPLRLFKFKGGTFSRHRVHSGGVTCVSKDGDEVLTLPPDTLVIPK